MEGHLADILFNLSMSCIGGLVKALTTKTKKKGYARFITSAFIGGFAGVLTYLLCSHAGQGWQITAFLTGLAGYMGESILNLFTEFVPTFLKKIFTGKLSITIVDDKEKENKEEKKEDK